MLASNARLLRPLGNRQFRLFWLGQSVSDVGSAIQNLAILWLVLDRFNSPLIATLAMLAVTVPSIVAALAGGVRTDRLDPRTIMVQTDILRAGIVGLLALLSFNGMLPLWLLFALLIGQGLVTGLATPAASSTPRRLVVPDQLQASNSLTEFTTHLATVLGAPIAAFLVAGLGSPVAMAINAVTFAISALMLIQMTPIAPPGPGRRATVPFAHALREGFGYLRSQQWLQMILVIDGVLTIAAAGSMSIGLPLLVRERFSDAVVNYGTLLSSFGIGSIAGIVAIGVAPPVRRAGWTYILAQLVQAPLFAGLPFMPLPLATAALGTIGFLNSISAVIMLGMLHRHIDPAIRGRVFSLVGIVSATAVIASALVAGSVVEIASATTLFILTGVGIGTVSMSGLLMRGLRALT